MPWKSVPTLDSLISLMRITYRDTRKLAERLPDPALRTEATLIADRLLRTLTQLNAEPKRPGRLPK